MLAKADTISATVLALEPGYCNVTLIAAARKRRNESVAGSAASRAWARQEPACWRWWARFYPSCWSRCRWGLDSATSSCGSTGPSSSGSNWGSSGCSTSWRTAGARSAVCRRPRLIDLLANEVRKALSS